MQNFNELNYFLTLAQTQSFVKVGQLLGISSSALSHSMKNLEMRLNLRLLNRTTRNVSLTEAGQQLFEQLFPLYQSINHEVDALNTFLNTPSGLIRINAPAMAAEAVLYPKLKPILNQYPKIRLEIVVDDRSADIVKERFDMGVRLGNEVAKEMIAVPISAPLKMALVASPDYLAQHGSPKNIDDLQQHRLIGAKLSAAHGAEMQWEFKDKKSGLRSRPNRSFPSIIICACKPFQTASASLGCRISSPQTRSIPGNWSSCCPSTPSLTIRFASITPADAGIPMCLS